MAVVGVSVHWPDGSRAEQGDGLEGWRHLVWLEGGRRRINQLRRRTENRGEEETAAVARQISKMLRRRRQEGLVGF
ncbi:unnamed protein product [Linum tenue]|uniref:Uncharacterized protein n=1 Tax=Linum tenue TaxID=586396 RepID=A0AAV0MA56_9ROSI|nr:unnamed protein product [Linum tenue]